MKNFGVAWLTTNRNCNNNCSWCYARNQLSSKCKMDIEMAKMAVDKLKMRGVRKIVLIGGEPTIYPNFIELVKYIHVKDIKVVVASNGRIFKNIEFAQKAKEAGIDSVDISIKATDKKTYIDNTCADGFQEMIDGYHNLKKVGIKVTASYVIVNDSTEEFDKLIYFLEKENFTSISLQFVKPCLSLEEKDSIMSVDKMGKFVTYIYNRMKQTNINYGIEVSFPICMIEEEIWDKLVIENRISNCCHVPKGIGINFDENFKIIPCNHFAEFPFSEIPVDFNKENSIEEIMESEVVKEFRNIARSYPTVKCQTCDKWNICGGGCFTRWLTEDPNVYIK
ncbi:MAG: radical SAM protein [Clostridiales bacterium]|nr:radical SAM protein [Clostridiales bacterium]